MFVVLELNLHLLQEFHYQNFQQPMLIVAAAVNFARNLSLILAVQFLLFVFVVVIINVMILVDQLVDNILKKLKEKINKKLRHSRDFQGIQFKTSTIDMNKPALNHKQVPDEKKKILITCFPWLCSQQNMKKKKNNGLIKIKLLLF